MDAITAKGDSTMHISSCIRTMLLAVVAAASSNLFAGSLVTVDFTATLKGGTSLQSSPPVIVGGFVYGDQMSGSYTYDTSIADTDANTSKGVYPGALTGYTLDFGKGFSGSLSSSVQLFVGDSSACCSSDVFRPLGTLYATGPDVIVTDLHGNTGTYRLTRMSLSLGTDDFSVLTSDALIPILPTAFTSTQFDLIYDYLSGNKLIGASGQPLDVFQISAMVSQSSYHMPSAPVAEAGENVEAAVGDRVQFYGLNSTDESDNPSALHYAWTLLDKPQGSTSILQYAATYYPQLVPDLPGTYRLQLVVTNTAGQSSTPDTVEVTAGLFPKYIIKAIETGSTNYSRNGTDYQYNSDNPYSLAVGGGKLVFAREQSSYDSTTQQSTYTRYFKESDGTTTETRLSTGQLLSAPSAYPVDVLYSFSYESRMLNGDLYFYGYVKRTEQTGAVRYLSGPFKLDQSGTLSQLLQFPVLIEGTSRSVAGGWYYQFTPSTVGFQYLSQPYTYKKWSFTDDQGVSRTYNYNDQDVYAYRDGKLTLRWDTKRPLPGNGPLQYPYSINLVTANDAGDMAIRADWPSNRPDACSTCWDTALILVKADGSAETLARTDADAFLGYYIQGARFDGNDLLVGLQGQHNGFWDWSIYRYDGMGLSRYVAGPYLNTPNWYTYLYPYGFSAVNGNLLLNSSPTIVARVDGRLRKVASADETLDGVTGDYLHTYAQYGNNLLDEDAATVGFNGQKQLAYHYTSSTDYSGQYRYDVFLGLLDSDRDDIIDREDNCPRRPNPDQEDADGNGIGDVCEDSDADGTLDPDDNCPLQANADQLDSDADTYGNACDVCPLIADDQADGDGDGIGDACDPDLDNDGVDDTVDNCPTVSNPAPQSDLDGDGAGDACDPDKDGDGIYNVVDGTYDGTLFTDQSEQVSNDFTDQHRGGGTFGRVIRGGGTTWTVDDAPDGAEGVLITTNGSGRLKACGGSTPVTWVGGTTAPLTCGSVSVSTWFGLVQIATDDSEDIVISVPQAAKVKLIDEPTGEVAILVPPESAVTVTAKLGDSITAEIGAASTVIVEKPAPSQYEIINSTSSVGPVTVTMDGTVVTYEPGETGVPVTINIKPDSSDNSINLGSNGVVPVAILSSVTFDATQVDPLSIRLASAPVKLKGKGTTMYTIEDYNGDGLNDLVVKVETSALELSSTSKTATLTGMTVSGVAIKGSDAVRVVPK